MFTLNDKILHFSSIKLIKYFSLNNIIVQKTKIFRHNTQTFIYLALKNQIPRKTTIGE